MHLRQRVAARFNCGWRRVVPGAELPAYMASVNMTEVPLGVGSSDTDLSYTFAAPVTVSTIMPLRGPAAGHTLLDSRGHGLWT